MIFLLFSTCIPIPYSYAKYYFYSSYHISIFKFSNKIYLCHLSILHLVWNYLISSYLILPFNLTFYLFPFLGDEGILGIFPYKCILFHIWTMLTFGYHLFHQCGTFLSYFPYPCFLFLWCGYHWTIELHFVLIGQIYLLFLYFSTWLWDVAVLFVLRVNILFSDNLFTFFQLLSKFLGWFQSHIR